MIYSFGIPVHIFLMFLVPLLFIIGGTKFSQLALKTPSILMAVITLPIYLVLLIHTFSSVEIVEETTIDDHRYVSVVYSSTLSKSRYYIEERYGVWPLEFASRHLDTYEGPLFIETQRNQLVVRLYTPKTGYIILKVGSKGA